MGVTTREMMGFSTTRIKQFLVSRLGWSRQFGRGIDGSRYEMR